MNHQPRTAGHIDAAFRALLADNMDESRKQLALAQVSQFGQRPYEHGMPTRDVIGNAIVFKDPDGWRYSVEDVHENGAHVRVMTSPQAGGPNLFEVRAVAALQAQQLVHIHATRRGLRDVRLTSSMVVADQWIALRYMHGAALD